MWKFKVKIRILDIEQGYGVIFQLIVFDFDDTGTKKHVEISVTDLIYEFKHATDETLTLGSGNQSLGIKAAPLVNL